MDEPIFDTDEIRKCLFGKGELLFYFAGQSAKLAETALLVIGGTNQASLLAANQRREPAVGVNTKCLNFVARNAPNFRFYILALN